MSMYIVGDHNDLFEITICMIITRMWFNHYTMLPMTKKKKVVCMFKEILGFYYLNTFVESSINNTLRRWLKITQDGLISRFKC